MTKHRFPQRKKDISVGWQRRALEEAEAIVETIWQDLPQDCRDVIADVAFKDPSDVKPWQAAIIVEHFSSIPVRK